MGRHALVVGGTRGIGAAVSRALAASGRDLVVTFASDEESATRIGEDIRRSSGRTVHTLRADVADLASVGLIEEFLAKDDISLDAVVIVAGVTSRQAFGSIQTDDWNAVLTANVTFPVMLLQAIADRIQPGGAVVLTGSSMGIHPHSVSLAYGVTKAAVHALAGNLVKVFAPRGIRVNAIAPGFVETDWHATKTEEHRRSIEGKIALGRFADPDEIAAAYLMAVDNPYLNGAVIPIDGGYSYR